MPMTDVTAPENYAGMFGEAADVDPNLQIRVWTMRTSSGADYYVSFEKDGRQATPHVFSERFKAEYHVALYRWLLLNEGEYPDVMAFDEDEWPARLLTQEEKNAFAALAAEGREQEQSKAMLQSAIEALEDIAGMAAGDASDTARSALRNIQRMREDLSA